MYSDEDLEQAVKQGIFTQSAVRDFRQQFTRDKTPVVDEEHFRLLTGFNDIFVVIACGLLLFSALNIFDDGFGLLAFTGLSWLVAEFFVLKRRMALPAIALLLAFVGGAFALAVALLKPHVDDVYVIASAIAIVAAYAHWRRFHVPLTVAAGSAAGIGFLVASVLAVFPGIDAWLMPIIFSCGLTIFIFAMYWDASDRQRVTRRSDVAFWLHLLSAPLIIHPVFTSLGILSGEQSLLSMVVVLVLYLLMTLISVAVDRRAFMVSSLVYVIYALTNLFNTYGLVGYSLAFTGMVIGSGLLLLSAYWHHARSVLFKLLPAVIQRYIPELTK